MPEECYIPGLHSAEPDTERNVDEVCVRYAVTLVHSAELHTLSTKYV
jgi:hypothetical protein